MAAYRVAHAVPGRLRVRYPRRWLRRRRVALEAAVARIPGVRGVTATALTGSLVIEYDRRRVAAPALLDALSRLAPAAASGSSNGARQPRGRTTGLGDDGGLARFLIASGVFTATCLPLPGPVGAALVLGSGAPLAGRALRTLAGSGRLSVDVLDAVTLLVLALRGNYRAAGLLIWLLAAGQYVLHRSVVTVRRSIRDFLASPEQPVWREDAGHRVRVPVQDLRAGDVVVVGQGDRVPADGTVVRGEALIQQQWVTGEGLPVERVPGERVYASTVVEDGEVAVRVERLGDETSVGRIIEAVEAAEGEKPELQLFAEKLADRLVLQTLGLAAAATAVTQRAEAGIAILAADYGTAVRVAVPTVAMVARAGASRAGVLLKGPSVLERLARVDTVVFDKTGTLTLGAPRVRDVVAVGAMAPDHVVRLAAAAELGVRHPVARAVIREAVERELDIPSPSGPEQRAGLGVGVRVEGARVLVGSRRFMEAHGIDLGPVAAAEADCRGAGASPLFVAVDGTLAGMLALQDELRADAPAAVAALRARRMRNVIMVSGDHREPTRTIAEALGVRHYYPDLLPEDKAALIRRLRGEQRVVAMVGDGVNDALALQEADVGIAVPGGPEVVAEAAAAVLFRGGLEQVARTLDLAQGTMREFQRVIDVAVGANLLVVGLASFGLAGPTTSILVSNGVPVAVALSSLLGGRENVNVS
jgi:Cu2+-exporting ATPase